MNYVALVVAAIVSMIIGHVRYGPLFGKKWRKLTHMKKEDMDKDAMPKIMGIAFLNSLVTMYVLSYFISMLGDGTMMGAMTIAFWVWLGFILTQQVSATLWSKRPSLELVMLNSLYWLVVVLAATIVFSAM